MVSSRRKGGYRAFGDPLGVFEHLLKGVPLEVLVGAPFESQEGWLYELTGDAESTASRSEET